jgi:hypothetical protein
MQGDGEKLKEEKKKYKIVVFIAELTISFISFFVLCRLNPLVAANVNI